MHVKPLFTVNVKLSWIMVIGSIYFHIIMYFLYNYSIVIIYLIRPQAAPARCDIVRLVCTDLLLGV